MINLVLTLFMYIEKFSGFFLQIDRAAANTDSVLDRFSISESEIFRLFESELIRALPSFWYIVSY